MAIYAYHCSGCNFTFEKLMKMSDSDKDVVCEKCDKKAKKLLSQVFGSGTAEPWEYEYTHKANPKYVRDSKGNRMKFNPSTMRKGRKGAG